MILKTLHAKKCPVPCATIPSLISTTEWCSSTEGATFVTRVYKKVSRVTYILFRHRCFDIRNYIIVTRVCIIQQVQFLIRNEISRENEYGDSNRRKQ